MNISPKEILMTLSMDNFAIARMVVEGKLVEPVICFSNQHGDFYEKKSQIDGKIIGP